MNDEAICDFVKSLYEPTDAIPLHRPILGDPEKSYLSDCIDSNFVSSVGARVSEFEERLAHFTGFERTIATVNGTAALHVALQALGVGQNEEVITQPLTFIATCNSISLAGAAPVFVDVERATLGLDPLRLEDFLRTHVRYDRGRWVNRTTGRRIAACVPVDVYGHPCRSDAIAEVCSKYEIILVEDAAEALGSYKDGIHVGHHSTAAVLSFNGNKIITTGGGGAVLTDDHQLADLLKYITTTAKQPHPYLFYHDRVAYNYRLPNLNAALGCAQMDQIDAYLSAKRRVAYAYRTFFDGSEIEYSDEPAGCRSNYWLNCILFPSTQRCREFLEYSNAHGVMTRPFWTLMPDLPPYASALSMDIPVARDLYDRGVALPSSVPLSHDRPGGL